MTLQFDHRSQTPTWRRIGPAALAAALPLIAILAGVFISAGGGNAAAAPGTYRPVPSTAAAAAPTLSPTPNSPATLPPGPGALVAVVNHATVMRSSPGGPTLHRLATHTEYSSPETLWVVAPRGRWLGVVSPLAGNARLGWIPRSAASLQRVNWEIKVSLSARSLTVLHGGAAIKRYTVAVGRPEAPTPTGRFAVTDRLATGDPTGPYGCCIIALSALAPHAIQNWSGGNRIAIHSTTETVSIGQPVSHGCLRLTLAEGRWLLSHIPLGTPTLISA
jgi:lipoprotein-anchoring transpeptidase ErfK/SrfK